jgi:hypothetical protein
MNSNTLIMCNRRTISETITGPATDALERSLKRPRTEKSTDRSHSTFYFPELYSDLVATIDGSDESFPSISWNLDDESCNDDCSYTSRDQLHPSTHSFMKCTKRVSNSMQRSKSFRTNLADMSERPTFFNQRLMFESNLEPIRIVDEDVANKIFPRISKAFSDSTVFESDHLTQLFNSKIQKQDDVDNFQHSMGYDTL